jgi:sodium/potassium-transporting ATPase subunit alpha
MEDPPNPTRQDEIHSAPRAVVLPEDTIREEKVTAVRGVEMTHRSITREEKELAAAGYDHLSTPKDPKADKETNIDIHEHNLSFDGLTNELKTNFDLKDPGHSFGLTSDEAKVRLARDGPNMLTPPKKKSALRKVCFCLKLSLTIT